jgi:hypothetical protein
VLSCLLLAAAAGSLGGCSSASTSDAGTTCGTAHTAVGVPVIIKVAKGNVGCATALGIENKYTAMIKAGDVRGNGGGAPVTVNGWTCQGYLTPEILQTGDASQCHTSTASILAVLPATTPSPAATVSG